MQEIKKEVIESTANYHLDDMKVILEESPIKEMKEEFSKSDHEDEKRLVTNQQHVSVDGLNESVTEDCPIKENFEEISLKEEVSEEFVYADTIFCDVNELCAKSEGTLPNISKMSLEQQDSIQKKTVETISLLAVRHLKLYSTWDALLRLENAVCDAFSDNLVFLTWRKHMILHADLHTMEVKMH